MQYPEFLTQRRIVHWVPFAFCSFLSIIALIGSVVEAFQGNRLGFWGPAFFGFLPMCFFYMGAVTTGLQREINDLQERLKTAASAEATTAQG